MLDPNELPDDYEACAECGFDHAYEYEEAYRWHSENLISCPECGEVIKLRKGRQ